MAVTRRATTVDATWARAWTVTTAAELTSIVDSPGVIGPRHGDVAFAQDTGFYYLWRDDGTWFAEAAVTSGPDFANMFLLMGG